MDVIVHGKVLVKSWSLIVKNYLVRPIASLVEHLLQAIALSEKAKITHQFFVLENVLLLTHPWMR